MSAWNALAAQRRDRMVRVAEMVRKEFRQIFRDPRMSRIIFVAPLVQLLAFGYAVSTDIRHTATFLVDHDQTRASREMVEALTASGYFQVVGRSDRAADLVDALDHGRVLVGIEIPAGFAREITSGQGADVQLLFDGTNSNTATVAKGYAERILQRWAMGSGPVRLVAPVDLRERAWFNPDLASRNYNVPAVIGAIIQLICQLLTALAIVREREIGTLEQLMVSPLTPVELILGKTIPFALIGILDLGLVTVAAMLWFHIPFEGSWLLLLLGSILFLLSCLGIGLLLSTVSHTQQEAYMLSFLIFMPTMLLSGFMFPVSSMPPVFQWLTLVNPLRHYLVIVRGLFLKGAGFGALWHQYLALAILGTGVLAFATSRFHKTIR